MNYLRRLLVLGSCSALLALHGCADEEDPKGGGYPGYDGSVVDSGSPGGGSGWDSGYPGGGGWDSAVLDDSGAPLDGGAVLDDGGSSDGSLADGGGGDGGLAAPLPKGKDVYMGWTWVEVPGSLCRDGSPAGYFYRLGKKRALMIYLNGGGACADPFFCGLNPKNVNEDLPIELLIGGAPNLIFGPNAHRQVAPDEGIFKQNEPRNPVTDWDMIYVPYCTGDIHAGSKRDVTVPNVAGKQQFVGYTNLGLFMDSFGPSFANTERVLLTGSSAGGFGSLLNFDRFQMYFDKWGKEVMAVSDSGLPMRDKYMSTCLQKKWRDYWGLNEAFPKECTGCFRADGGGLTEGAFNYYFGQKYKDRMLGGLITTVNDQIIRAFFAPGMSSTAGQPDDCTLEPGGNTVFSSLLLGQYTGEKYREGLKDVYDTLVKPSQVGYYAIGGDTHMHLWRGRFFEKNGNTKSIAEWLKDILDHKPTREGQL